MMSGRAGGRRATAGSCNMMRFALSTPERESSLALGKNETNDVPTKRNTNGKRIGEQRAEKKTTEQEWKMRRRDEEKRAPESLQENPGLHGLSGGASYLVDLWGFPSFPFPLMSGSGLNSKPLQTNPLYLFLVHVKSPSTPRVV